MGVVEAVAIPVDAKKMIEGGESPVEFDGVTYWRRGGGGFLSVAYRPDGVHQRTYDTDARPIDWELFGDGGERIGFRWVRAECLQARRDPVFLGKV